MSNTIAVQDSIRGSVWDGLVARPLASGLSG